MKVTIKGILCCPHCGTEPKTTLHQTAAGFFRVRVRQCSKCAKVNPVTSWIKVQTVQEGHTA